MVSNKKIPLLLLILTLVLTACGGEETAAIPTEAVAAAVPTETAEQPTTQSIAPTAIPTADSPTAEPAPTESETATEPDPTAAETQEAPPAEAQINGRYETTYYRGLETAAITMIDYSDFL